MKCKKCGRNMIKKQAQANSYYFECESCHATVGKPAKESEENGNEADGEREN